MRFDTPLKISLTSLFVSLVLSGESLIGASVIIRSLQRGSSSNEYGYFSITIPSGKYIFEVSYIGYDSKVIEIILDQSQVLNIELTPIAEQLDEVILEVSSETVPLIVTFFNVGSCFNCAANLLG